MNTCRARTAAYSQDNERIMFDYNVSSISNLPAIFVHSLSDFLLVRFTPAFHVTIVMNSLPSTKGCLIVGVFHDKCARLFNVCCNNRISASKRFHLFLDFHAKCDCFPSVINDIVVNNKGY